MTVLEHGGAELPVVGAGELTWLTVDEMREVDRVAMEIGLDLPRMMENAGANLASLARSLLGGDVTGRRIAVLAGPGGNGGGGLVAARRLMAAGAEVDVRLAQPSEAMAPVPRHQLSILEQMGARLELGRANLAEPDLAIDALLGYSQRGAPTGVVGELIEHVRAWRVISLDVPTGLELETGTIREPAVRAQATMTLALPKRALRAPRADAVRGALFLADISIPPVVYERLDLAYGSPFGRGPIVAVDVS